MPLVLHEGFTPYQISGLADEDNENDEYHASVPIADVWMDYKWLADEGGAGWTQQAVADAKGVKQQVVSSRIKYAEFPQLVLARFTKNDSLRESHAAEISKIQNFCNLDQWRTFESVALSVIDAVLDRVRVKAPTKSFR